MSDRRFRHQNSSNIRLILAGLKQHLPCCKLDSALSTPFCDYIQSGPLISPMSCVLASSVHVGRAVIFWQADPKLSVSSMSSKVHRDLE